MDQAEASGKTVEDALRTALARLGARRDQVEMTVLDEGRRGLLFGRGGRDALVRIEWLPGEGPEPGSERPQRGRGRRGGRGTRATGAAGAERERPQRGQRRESRGRRQDDFVETASPKLTEADFLGRTGAEKGTAGRNSERRPARAGRDDRQRSRPRPREEQPEIAPNIDAEEVDFAASVVDDILRILDIEAEINLREPMTPGDGRGSALAVIDIMGDDLGVLIGRRGETLLNLQYLVNLVLSHRFPGKGGVTIDAEHYRHRREQDLAEKATRMADIVRESGDEITLEPMTPADRRIIHLCLADDPDVTTESVGEGENRKVVILPRG